jgi:hypothetical protein
MGVSVSAVPIAMAIPPETHPMPRASAITTKWFEWHFSQPCPPDLPLFVLPCAMRCELNISTKFWYAGPSDMSTGGVTGKIFSKCYNSPKFYDIGCLHLVSRCTHKHHQSFQYVHQRAWPKKSSRCYDDRSYLLSRYRVQVLVKFMNPHQVTSFNSIHCRSSDCIIRERDLHNNFLHFLFSNSLIFQTSPSFAFIITIFHIINVLGNISSLPSRRISQRCQFKRLISYIQGKLTIENLPTQTCVVPFA